MRKHLTNWRYWMWRWAKAPGIIRALTAIPVFLFVGVIAMAVAVAACLPFLVYLGLSMGFWESYTSTDPAHWYNKECRRNCWKGLGYRVYWPE